MSYTGLCIDGPKDGWRIEAQYHTVQMEQRPPTKIVPSAEAMDEPVETTTVTYRHHVVKGTGLWLLEDETPEQAVQHMVNRVGIEALASRYEQITTRQKDDARHARR